MEDREFDRLQIENTNGQIHAKNDKAHSVKELPLCDIPEINDLSAETYRSGETGLIRESSGKEGSAAEGAASSSHGSFRKPMFNLITSSTISAPIVATLAAIVSAVLVFTSVVGSLTVNVALRAKTAFSLIFSLSIENPEEVPLFAVLSADDQDEIEKPLHTEDTELVFENLRPDTKYTLRILKYVQSDSGGESFETVFEKFYYTDPESERDPIVYTVTEEQWNAAIAPERFENVTVRMTSYDEEAGQQGRENEEENGSTTVIANGYSLQFSEGWISLRPAEEGETSESLWVLHELAEMNFADFTFDEASNLYRFTRKEGKDRPEEDNQPFEESSVVKYAVGFKNGVLTSVEERYESSYDGGKETYSSTVLFAFDGYGTSFITTETADGIGYVRSSANDTWIAYERQDREQTEVTIPAKIRGRAVTRIAPYVFYYDAEGLSVVTLPASLTHIGYNFWNCSGLSAVCFAGTPEQWRTITTDPYGNSNVPTDLPVYFNGEKPEVNPHTVTEEEWNAALVPEAFENVTVYQISSSSGSDQPTQSNRNESITVFAGGKTLCIRDSWISVYESGGMEGADNDQSLWSVLESVRTNFADFTFDETTNVYRYESYEQEPDYGYELHSYYTVGFYNGSVISIDVISDFTFDQDQATYVDSYNFDQYGTSYFTTESVDGIGYVISSANETWIAYERQDWERSEFTVPAEINQIAVTDIAPDVFNTQGISTVTLPASLLLIGNNFWYCADLSAIYYAGTQAQWIGITTDFDSGESTVPSDLPVYFYSEDRPDESPTSYWHYIDGMPARWR